MKESPACACGLGPTCCCASGPRQITSSVQTYASMGGVQLPATYRLERLPSQQTPSFDPILALAEQALARAGLQRNDDSGNQFSGHFVNGQLQGAGTYDSVDGEQYIGVTVGYGGAVPLWGGDMAELTKPVAQGGSFWVFKIPAWDSKSKTAQR